MDTVPNLNGNKNSFVLFLVPSGNNPIAPPSFKKSKADDTDLLSFFDLSTGIHPALLKNQANFLLSKYSFFAIYLMVLLVAIIVKHWS